ncbi:MAG: glycosyltransferase [Terriglobales bacterium]
MASAIHAAAPPLVAGARPRVLAVLPYGPNPIRGRTADALRQLTALADVDLICLDDGSPIELPAGIRARTVIPNASAAARAWRVLVGLLHQRPITQEFYNAAELPRILAGMDLSAYDCIYVERLPVFRYLSHPNVVYDCVDCCSHLNRLMASSAPGYKRFLYALDAMLLPSQEEAACNAAALVLVSAEREARELRQLGVKTPIEVWVHDVRDGVQPRRQEPRERLVVSFHGKLSYAANELGLSVLNNVIAPALDPARFELRIVGKCPPHFPRRYRNLKFTGFVPSMFDIIRDSDLSVFPLPVSVGFPNKVMESLAAGVPCIATANVMEGLPSAKEILGRGVLVRDAADFVTAIESFSPMDMETRQHISRSCCEYAERVYSAPGREEQWKRILSGVGTTRVLSAAAQL